ncbi:MULTISPECIES: glycosyltransferase [unclassified Halomonas]|uniref:glycosyltransferase n=1 Tax=unclassified Halomonas TaxID=2609666 RepID=UPI00288475E6|nr:MULTISPECIES: glycosyltransferase [unclassified Halomonas]MDT0510777.1 glycosyltransferase [Halomonas sp. LES1]MDT0591694.1 glycosyltransferase [Halomonas sp. PAR8]
MITTTSCVKESIVTSQSIQPVTLFIPSLSGGGAERVFVNLANEFARQSAAPVDLVVARSGGPLVGAVSSDVRIVDLGKKRVAHAMLPLLGYLRRERPQALLSTMSEANVIALLAWQLAGRPCRIAIRETCAKRSDETVPPGIRQAALRWMMTRLYPRADTMVVIADDVLATLQRDGIHPGRCCHIGNPVTPHSASALTSSTRASASSTPGSISAAGTTAMPSWLELLPREAQLICSAGRLVEAKGFDLLLAAFARLQDPRLHLAILGDGPLHQTLLAQARELGVEERVHLPGFVAQPQHVMALSRLFVSSSRREGFPNVLLDALVAGVPIVATHCPGASADILEHGRHGVLVPPESVERLVTAMTRALQAPVGTPESRQARADDFNLSHIARRYLHEALEVVEPQPSVEAVSHFCPEERA